METEYTVSQAIAAQACFSPTAFVYYSGFCIWFSDITTIINFSGSQQTWQQLVASSMGYCCPACLRF